MKQFKIGVCIPTRDVWKADFGQSLSLLGMATLPQLPDDVQLGLTIYNKTQCSIPHLARNQLVLQALKDGCTHILFLDDDMRFNPRSLLVRFLLGNKDIIAANCTTKEFPPRPTAESGPNKVYTRADSAGFERVDSVGTALMLIKAEVFKKMRLPWFDHEWLDLEKLADKLQDPNFDYKTINTDELALRGEDRFFCKKAREAGFEIWIDHVVSKDVHHIGDWPYAHSMIPGYRDHIAEDSNGKVQERKTIN